MRESDSNESSATPGQITPEAASELNNLLQIVSGTVEMLENVWEGAPGSEKYFDMLRVSVDRAAKVTAQLVQQAGGTDQKILLHPAMKARAKPPASARSAQEKKRSILVVDDEPMALTLSKHVLSEAGYEVTTAQSGFDALDLFRKSPVSFDLVLLDLTMPFMDGEETFSRLLVIDSNVPVILNTGFIEEHRLKRMMDAGLSGFLRRPYRPDELITQVQAVLARGRSRIAALTNDQVPAAAAEVV